MRPPLRSPLPPLALLPAQPLLRRKRWPLQLAPLQPAPPWRAATTLRAAATRVMLPPRPRISPEIEAEVWEANTKQVCVGGVILSRWGVHF